MSEWPTVCVTYSGGMEEDIFSVADIADATEFDLNIINRIGDRFLTQPGVRWLGGPYELTVAPGPVMTMQ